MVVTFCGHRRLQDRNKVKAWLESTLAELIRQGADIFYLGGYGDFDTLSAEVLKKLKKASPNIRLIFVVPYLGRTGEGYDETIYPELEKVPPRFAILKRNEWMVQKADIIVAYITHSYGGAFQTFNFARRKKKKIISYQ